MSIDRAVAQLLAYAEKFLCLSPRDEVYARNRLLDLLGETDFSAPPYEGALPDLPDAVLEDIFRALEGAGRSVDRASLGDRLMDAVMLRPSEYESRFAECYAESPVCATDWAHAYAVRSNYVKKSAVDQNIRWHADNGLEITINLSKPEKNNKDLQKQLDVKSTNYPPCTICRENEGYERPGFSRRNLRTCSLRLAGEDWFWQYSPYAYFAEHGIAVSAEHAPMKLDEKTAVRLFDFVEQFPQYFIGNNAPLPRVGGSILMHDHFQGGKERLPMQRAAVRIPLKSPSADVRAGVIDWHNSALRLEGENRGAIESLAYSLVTAWRAYKNEELGILPFSGEVPHNTASLIARKTERGYILDMILRNNRTSAQYPDGIFHAHREYHHIKSESIGLIEAMGLFVLPARLKRQLAQVREYLTGARVYRAEELEEDMRIFAPAIERLTARGTVLPAQADSLLKAEVEESCCAILDNTAVFKRDEAGEQAFLKFLSDAGFPAERRTV